MCRSSGTIAVPRKRHSSSQGVRRAACGKPQHCRRTLRTRMTYTVTGLMPLTTYDFHVRACDLQGCSSWSNTAPRQPNAFQLHVFVVLAGRLALGDGQLEEAVANAGSDRRVQVTGDDPPGTWWMPVSLYLLQAINHDTEHRSQVATILTHSE